MSIVAVSQFAVFALTRGEIEAIGGLLLYWLAFGLVVVIAKVILDRLLWSILGLDLFGAHVEEAQRLRVEREVYRQQRAYDRQVADEQFREEKERQRADAETRRSEAQLHSECEAARQHLVHFCRKNEGLLADIFPPALVTAFVRSQMPDNVGPTVLWEIAQKKIAELLPVIQQEKDRARKDHERRAARDLRLKNLDAEIAANRATIDRLRKSGLDPETVEDETQGLLAKIRSLEQQKDLLKTLNEDR